jgi:hypothetical protein
VVAVQGQPQRPQPRHRFGPSQLELDTRQHGSRHASTVTRLIY